MIRKTLLAATMVACVAAKVSAQAPAQAPAQDDPRVELSATAGWTFSDGVSGDAVVVPSVGAFDRVDPKDSFAWGARLGFNLTSNVEVGALFDQQSTKLEFGGTTTREINNLSVRNYHGYFAFNFGGSGATARPYLLGGLGATQYGSLKIIVNGVQRDLSGATKFSTTWGAGLKVFPSSKFGIRLEGRWTPTYIKSDAAGWWCDPYWGCYLLSDAQYSNQYELSGGMVLRF